MNHLILGGGGMGAVSCVLMALCFHISSFNLHFNFFFLPVLRQQAEIFSRF